MKYEQYVSLIKDLEVSAAQNRRLYELKVIGLAFLGYAYFVALILLFVALPVMIIVFTILRPEEMLKLLLWTAKFWWAAIPGLALYFGFLGSAVKAMFTKVPEPEETVLERQDAPELFEFIDSTCKALQAKRPRKVFLTDQFNAAVVTMPYFGIFGTKVYMLIGLPVMRALSPEQLKAVIAHEIGHISGKHGRVAKWTYQLEESWRRFIEFEELEGNKLAALYEKFVQWFFPLFQAYSFVLMREHEKEADDSAVEIVGGEPLAESLITLWTRSSELETSFWTKIQEENQQSETPSPNVFSRMYEAIGFVDQHRDAQTIEKAIAIPTDYNDSHPSLADRLKRIGYWNGTGLPVIPAPPDKSAADHFLGTRLSGYLTMFEDRWNEQISANWKANFEHFKAARARVEELETKGEELSVEELLEKAGLIAQQKGSQEALPLLRAAYEREPDNPETNYTLGAVLLQNDDASGMGLLRRAIELDPQWKYAASDVAFQYLRSKGQFEEAKEFAEVLDSQAEEYEMARQERERIYEGDQFSPHDFDAETVAQLVQKIRYYDEVTALYLVKKDVRYMEHIPFHVLFIDKRKAPRLSLSGTKDMKTNELLDAIHSRLVSFDIGFFAVFDGSLAHFKPTVEAVPNAQIFLRTEE